MKKLIAAVITTGAVLLSSASGASAGSPTSVNTVDGRADEVEGRSFLIPVEANISAINTAIADLYSGEKGIIVGMGDVGGPVVAFVQAPTP